jgi:hypothetical protein
MKPSTVAASVVDVATMSHSFFPSPGNVDSRLLDGGFSWCTVASFVVECRMPANSILERGSGKNGGNDGIEVQPSNERIHHVSIVGGSLKCCRAREMGICCFNKLKGKIECCSGFKL